MSVRRVVIGRNDPDLKAFPGLFPGAKRGPGESFKPGDGYADIPDMAAASPSFRAGRVREMHLYPLTDRLARQSLRGPRGGG